MQVIVTSCNGVVDNNRRWLSSKSVATKMGNSEVGHLQDSVTKKLDIVIHPFPPVADVTLSPVAVRRNVTSRSFWNTMGYMIVN